MNIKSKIISFYQRTSISKTSLVLFMGVSLLSLSGCSDVKLKVNGSHCSGINGGNIAVKAYIENSGSMNGYMCSGSELKDALYSYLSSLNNYASSVRLNYINSTAIPLKTSVGNLVSQLNPQAFSAAGGNMANSDFKQILNDVVRNVDDKTVVLFVSDCILDIPQGAAKDYLDITRTDINNIFTDKLKKMPSLGVCVYQLESKFDGEYYYPKGGHQHYVGKRPYYVWLIGAQQNLAYLQRNVPSEKIRHGIKNYCSYSPSIVIPTMLYTGGKKYKEQALKIKNHGMFSCKVLMDLSQTLLSEEYLADVNNFSSKSGDICIEKVEKMPMAKEYSHLLSITVPGSAFSDVLSLKSVGIASWVEASNGTSDSSIEQGKTFSIKYIIGGVSDAYAKYTEAGTSIFTANKH